jgi:hypothetical protein
LSPMRGWEFFSLHHCVQTGSEAHPASYPMGTRALSLGVKWPGSEADHSLPSSADIKNAWSYISTPQYTFMVWCSVKVQGQLYLLPFTPTVYFLTSSHQLLYGWLVNGLKST